MPSPVAKLKQHVANRKEEKKRKQARSQPYIRSSADHNEFADWDFGNHTDRSTVASTSRIATTETQAAPSTPRREPVRKTLVEGDEEQDHDDEDVAIYSDDEDDIGFARTYAQSNQLLMPSLDPDSYLRAHPSVTSLAATARSSRTTSPQLQRQSSSPLYTRETEPLNHGRPGYIHRTHTPTGTKFSLQDHSPSQRALSRVGTSSSVASLATATSNSDVSKSHLTLADLQRGFIRGIHYPDPESSGYTFPEHGSSDENMLSMSGNRRVHRRKKKSYHLPIMTEVGNAATIAISTPASPYSKGHKRSNLSLISGAAKQGPSDMSATTSRHGYQENTSRPTKADQLKAARLKTVKPDPQHELAPSSDRESSSQTAQQTSPDLRIEESPTRPSFEPETFTPAEYEAYAQLRLAYAHALVLERAAGPLVNLYNGAEWPAQFPNPITSAINSSLGFAREAALSFRHDVKRHPVYIKFQANGNDVATRARNDVYQSGGDLQEINERIEDWEAVDREEGVQVTKLVETGDR